MRIARDINWTILILFISIGLMITSLAFSAEKSKVKGVIDVDHPDIGEAKVEVNLAGPLFTLAAKAVEEDNPDASEFLASLRVVKVRIYDEVAFGDKTPDEVLEFYKKQLQKSDWELLARVREERSDVRVYALIEGDVVSGLVVLVVNIYAENKDAVIVNLAGEIDLTKLSEIDKLTGGALGLPEKLEFKALSPAERKKAKEQKEKALKSLFDGNPDKAIAILTELESEGVTSRVDHALLAMLYHSTGAPDMAYYHLGMLYELGGYSEVSTALYKKAVEINPRSAAAEKLNKTR
jgi:tetratricopeptide (TPR) repeat protein